MRPVESSEVYSSIQPSESGHDARFYQPRDWHHLFRQILRFGLVGGVNTLVDLLVLNGLLLLFPTTRTLMLLAYNSLAYSIGAINSFLLNKHWTFGHWQKTT